VSVRQFTQLKVIGKGSYGKVLLVEKKDTKKMYALKILKKNEILRRN
jgi:serum/glucocorticoid-regulated kinase 2